MLIVTSLRVQSQIMEDENVILLFGVASDEVQIALGIMDLNLLRGNLRWEGWRGTLWPWRKNVQRNLN